MFLIAITTRQHGLHQSYVFEDGTKTLIVFGASYYAFSVRRFGSRAAQVILKVRKFFADISYPIYLVHGPLGMALVYELHLRGVGANVAVIVGLACVFAFSYLLHRLVETPFNALGKRLTRKTATETVPVGQGSPQSAEAG
jgi:peptidoglycan/LPS O-acetylase OafA/YrhL